jgi:addiction module HigA family antidote
VDDVRPPHAGVILKQRFLDSMGITPNNLAKAIGVSQRRVSELVRSRRPITVDMALRLGLFFGVPPKWFLDLQAEHDTISAPELEALRAVVVPVSTADFLVTPTGAVALAPATPPRGTITVAMDSDLLARLRAQAALAPSRGATAVTEVRYETGLVGLQGR